MRTILPFSLARQHRDIKSCTPSRQWRPTAISTSSARSRCFFARKLRTTTSTSSQVTRSSGSQRSNIWASRCALTLPAEQVSPQCAAKPASTLRHYMHRLEGGPETPDLQRSFAKDSASNTSVTPKSPQTSSYADHVRYHSCLHHIHRARLKLFNHGWRPSNLERNCVCKRLSCCGH